MKIVILFTLSQFWWLTFFDPVNISFISSYVNVPIKRKSGGNWFSSAEFRVLFDFVLQFRQLICYTNALFTKNNDLSLVQDNKLGRKIIVCVRIKTTQSTIFRTAVNSVVGDVEFVEPFSFFEFEWAHTNNVWS